MKKIIVCALVLFAAAAPSPARQGGGRGAAGVYYRDGVRYALDGRLDEAAAAFEQAARLDPKDGDAHFSLGNVYSEQGRWTDAIAAYRKAVSLKKNDGEAYNGLGVALAARGEYEKAAVALRKAAEIFPQWAEPRFHLSHVYRKLGREGEARAAYSEALARRPDYAQSPPRSFTAQFVKARVEPRAERAAASTGATTNTPTEVRTNAGTAPPPRASAPAPTAGTATPRPVVSEADAQFQLGVRHAAAGRDLEAAAAFERAVSSGKGDAETYQALGAAYARLGRWRESVGAYEQAVRLEPKNSAAYEALGRSYARLRETEPAAPAAAPATKAAPAAPATDADPTAVYRVGPGDVLEVRTPGNAQASLHKVTPAGLLDYPRLGAPLEVSGLTTGEIEARLRAELERRDSPAGQVSVGVREYESHAVIISGMVKDPGTKILRREGVPLYVIVAYAQPLAGAGEALVASKASGRTTAVNLSDTQAMGMLVRSGDVITVRALPEQFYYIAGAVRQPGQKSFTLGLTLTQAVLAAGGVSARDAATATVSRQGDDGRLTTTSYNLRDIEAGRAPDPALRPGDRVEVGR
ncbi:MAG TPA: tetratricopeptide repeat protein [Pyrinomonadaceae bacterium]|nr:tetratricopeptide repeat protein [Pyrinomonadaceae bacterium]